MRRNPVMAGRKLTLAALAVAALGLASTAQAQQTTIFDELLEKLKDKGVLTQDEYDALKAAREQEMQQQRAERRQKALKEAQAAEKDEKVKAEAPATLTGRFKNGFTWESGDKANSITLSGRIQSDYRYFEDSIQANTFDVRRAYLGVQGRLFNDWTFDVTYDAAQSGSSLDVAWINWGAYDSVQLRAGQFKMPMSIEELTSSRFIDFQERSFVNAFVPAKERGIMLHGVPYKGVFYGLAVSNGQGKNNNNTSSSVAGYDAIGRIGLNAAEFIDRKDMVLHGAVAYSSGNLPTGTSGNASANQFAVRTEARGTTFFTVANSTFNGTSLDRQREQGELSLAWGPVKLQGEYLHASYSGNNETGVSFDQGVNVYYVEAEWMITGEQYASAYRNGAYGRLVPKNNFSAKDGTWGAFALGLRYSDVDGGDFTPTNTVGTGRSTAGQTNGAHAWTLGLKWIMNPNVRAYLNYVQTDFDSPVTIAQPGRGNGTYDEEKAVTVRLGLDF